jgi:hypothetical protein
LEGEKRFGGALEECFEEDAFEVEVGGGSFEDAHEEV